MTTFSNHSHDDLQADIEQRLETVLETSDGDLLERVRSTVMQREERWFGELLVQSYESVADTSKTRSVLQASTTIELLYGYYLFRRNSLARHGDEASFQRGGGTTAHLLGGDYLHAVAYDALGGVQSDRLTECFAVLTTISRTMVEALHSSDEQASNPDIRLLSRTDEIAGVLGRGAVVIGTILGEAERAHREEFETIGRCCGSAHQLLRLLDANGLPGHETPILRDESRLHRFVDQRLEEANQALEDLSTTTEIHNLRRFIETTVYADE